jgi:drug/metabolite transporter (DMT)-like permease
MRVKTSLSILIMVIIGPLGNVLLRKGVQEIAPPAAWAPTVLAASVAQVLGSATIWLGIACLVTYVLAEMLVLSWADYSYVQPVAASGYGVVAVLGHVVLSEDVSVLRWLGVFIICLGVSIVGRTSPRTTKATLS